jgi:hypothetical protein
MLWYKYLEIDFTELLSFWRSCGVHADELEWLERYAL